MNNASPTRPEADRKKLVTWVVAGCFVVLAGTAAPRFLNSSTLAPLSSSNPDPKPDPRSDQSVASHPSVSKSETPSNNLGGPPSNQKAESVSNTDPGSAAGPTATAALTRLAAATVFVVLGGGITAYLFARKARAKSVGPAVANPLQVLGTMPVGRGVVYLVGHGNQRMIAAVDMTGLRTLVTIPTWSDTEQATQLGVPESSELPIVMAQRIRVDIPDGRRTA